MAGTVLITGGAGFIGCHTARALLARGWRVRILDILDPQIHGPGQIWPANVPAEAERILGDVCEPSDVARALKGVDAVYHFAALTGVGQSMYEMRNYTHVNCVGTATLLETIVKNQHSLHRIVLSSSRAVYGEGSHECHNCGTVYPAVRRREDLDSGCFLVFCPTCNGKADAIATAEARPLLPISLYGWTKKDQEDLVHYAAATYGLKTVALRYFNVYGSGQSLNNPYTGIVAIFYSRIMAGQPISVYEHGVPGRDFVHVSDVARANVAALECDAPSGSTFNVGSGVCSTIQQVAQSLAGACGRQVSFLDNGEFRVGDIHTCYADLSNTQRVLNYQPRVTLDQGMQEFVAWARTQDSTDQYEAATSQLASHGLFGRAGRRAA